MKKYKVISLNAGDVSKIETLLNKQLEQGYELVAFAYEGVFIFKKIKFELLSAIEDGIKQPLEQCKKRADIGI